MPKPIIPRDFTNIPCVGHVYTDAQGWEDMAIAGMLLAESGALETGMLMVQTAQHLTANPHDERVPMVLGSLRHLADTLRKSGKKNLMAIALVADIAAAEIETYRYEGAHQCN